MLIVGLVIVAVVLAVSVRFWVTRGVETIDLRSPEARQSAAASWLAAGESEEAEQMLQQAVGALKGWAKALALADLASFFAASSRDEEAATALSKAIALAEGEPAAPPEEVFEMRVQMAQAYSRQGLIEQARVVLLKAIKDAGDPLAMGLAEEAYAEFQVRHDELADAVSRYERACQQLAEADHDRAPIALVRYAHALTITREGDCWRAMPALSEELQQAVPIALAHLVDSFEQSDSLALIDSLLEHVGTCGHWQEARESLAQLAQDLQAPEPQAAAVDS